MLPTEQLTLPDVAQAIAMGTASALLLAIVAAAVLLVVEEFWLRRAINGTAISQWADHQPSKVWSDRGFWILRALVANKEYVGPNNRFQANKALTQLLGASLGLPPRQMLGVLAAAVRSDVSSAVPSALMCWLAAVGSAQTDALSDPDRETRDDNWVMNVLQANIGSAGAPPAVPGADAVKQEQLRNFVMQLAERALDSLQASLTRRWAMLRYAISVFIVGGVATAFNLSKGPVIPPIHIESFWQYIDYLFVLLKLFAPHAVMWLIAAAFVPIVMAPIQRLSERGTWS